MTMTIEQTVDIPEDGWFHLNLPPNFPAGASATVAVTVPVNTGNPPSHMSTREALEMGRGIAKRLGSALTTDRFLELKRQDRILEDSLDARHRKERMQSHNKKQGNV